jgi:hypothetical protein
MASEISRHSGPPKHVIALVLACAWGMIFVIARMILGAVADVDDTWNSILFVVGVVVAALLLLRSFLLYRQFKAGRS